MTIRNFFVSGILFFALSSACTPNERDQGALHPSASPIMMHVTIPNETSTPINLSPTPTVTLTPVPPPSATRTQLIQPTSTALPCWDEPGQVTSHRLETPISPLPWEFRVYTPPCYDQQSNRKYPTLYLIHGSTYTDEQWDRIGADETADLLISMKEISPFLIVMPRDRIWKEPAEDPFGNALIEYLIPWIDANYRTLTDRRFRAIGDYNEEQHGLCTWAFRIGNCLVQLEPTVCRFFGVIHPKSGVGLDPFPNISILEFIWILARMTI